MFSQKQILIGSLLAYIVSGSLSYGVYERQAQGKTMEKAPQINLAKALDQNHIQIEFVDGNSFESEDFKIVGNADIIWVKTEDSRSFFVETTELDYRQNYSVEVDGVGKYPVDLTVLLDNMISTKPLGCHIENNQTVFRLFAPRAHSVTLVIFEHHTDSTGTDYPMSPTEDGCWEFSLPGTLWGKYYGYKVAGPDDPTENFAPEQVVADPYSVAVCTKNTYRHEAKSLILNTKDYDWEGDKPLQLAWDDLIIYEMHVRDLTVHPSAGVKEKGTYQGLIEKGTKGGIDHILEMGVNAVELLPCQDFGNLEIPFGKTTNGMKNTWNPYAQNHWGYMTSYFFAPESYYASGGNLKSGEYCGVAGQQVDEFKDMVKAFHREGIAVIMDVVYNHVSNYDYNSLRYLDKKYYFRLDPMMDYLTFSGCGNDFRTEAPMARRLIVDSIKYWMVEYHIDGFRFDLATMIDWETIERITEAAKKVNPNVILIAEPWGGGKYDLGGFSDRGWAAWNDLIRNGVKGQNPVNGLGWIFGKYWGHNDPGTLQSYVRGSTRHYGGPFVNKSHSLNYLESHDDQTLGDFIRIANGDVKPDQKIKDISANAKLNQRQMQLNKLAAAFLLTSQGPVMIAEGQEFARSKVIAQTQKPEPHVGQIDHNSYNKDNETNWLNFEHKDLNQELVDYYKGLIRLRADHPAFRRTPGEQIHFLGAALPFAIGYIIPKQASGDRNNFIVLHNADPKEPAAFRLPDGPWRKVVDGKRAGNKEFGEIHTSQIKVPPTTAIVLIN